MPPDPPAMIDIHCHLLPGIDDGPRDWEQAVDLCRAMVEDGITRAITTPHFIDGVYENGRAVTGPLLTELIARLGDAGIALELDAAAEIDISSRLVSTGGQDIPSLGGHAVLLEMPVAVVPHAMEHILFAVSSRGMVPVLAHPERNHLVQENPELAAAWVASGAVLQLDAESLFGIWGGGAKRCAETLLTRGLVGAVASDSHSCAKRPPRMTAARKRVLELLGAEADHLVLATPLALIGGTFAGLPELGELPPRPASSREDGPRRGLLRRMFGGR